MKTKIAISDQSTQDQRSDDLHSAIQGTLTPSPLAQSFLIGMDFLDLRSTAQSSLTHASLTRTPLTRHLIWIFSYMDFLGLRSIAQSSLTHASLIRAPLTRHLSSGVLISSSSPNLI